MANLRFSFLATAGTVTVNAPDINPTQEALFVDWLWAMYAPVDTDPESPTFNEPLERTPANEVQAYRNYARGLWLGTRNNVIRWKQDMERAAIQPAVIPED